jgi:Flp pilus assembly protein TadG
MICTVQPQPATTLVRRLTASWAGLLETRASQIVEFAVALPLLVVFLVAIFDFGNAFSVKHKVANAAREGARFAANQPTTDLSSSTAGTNGSPEAIATLVGNYLLANKVNDCGLSIPGLQTVTPSGLTWTYTASSNGCPGTVTLTIERGYSFTTAASAVYPEGVNVEATRVTLSYPYKWQFNTIYQFLVSGGGFAGTSQISSVAVMQNLN